MLEFLFPRDWPHYAAGPQGPLVRNFSAWVVERGYTRICAQRHVHRFREVLAYNHVAAGTSLPITSTALSRWFAPWSHKTSYRATQRAAVRFLCDRGLFVPVAKPSRFDALISQYRSHLIDLRGLAPATVEQHLRTVTGFLSRACSKRRLASVRANDVERFVDQTSRRLCRQTLQHTIAHLRAFLRFCADQRYTRDRLDVIDTPRTYRGELPPRALNWRTVRRLLHSIDHSSVEGCRDHAILYLMAYYGLRPAEVASLTLDSIDWENDILRVDQCKTRSVLVMPLNDRTRHVLERYLRRRPPLTNTHQLFLRVRCPAGPIKAATIEHIYAKRARLSGLPVLQTSPGSLRHSFAMRLLERGVGVKMIGDLLGHHSLESTCVYLRLHVEALREVALPVPGRGRVSMKGAS
ncbi:integrase [Paraburkholderia hospita]|uniref:Integrase n=1 Tax=Paraburkholderia hospita TaxID=169430 RepID=A0AAN1JKX4_9BURK|nr:tyrosine-type recombinase/integrase [Paraburkholderia hospita]AUT75891.1 integrase [Paraburkholderia hospita]